MAMPGFDGRALGWQTLVLEQQTPSWLKDVPGSESALSIVDVLCTYPVENIVNAIALMNRSRK